jgi:hypothetical protein
MSTSPPAGHYDVFISYSRVDADIARPLADTIRELSADRTGGPWRVFVDTAELRGGDTWYRRIMTAVAGCRCFLALLSPTYLESRMCMEEWDTAVTRQIGERVSLMVPVLAVDCRLPPDMAKTQYHDLRDARPGSARFAEVAARLLGDLAAIVEAARGDDTAAAEAAAAIEAVARPEAAVAARQVPVPARIALEKLERAVREDRVADAQRAWGLVTGILGADHPEAAVWKPLIDSLPPQPVSRAAPRPSPTQAPAPVRSVGTAAGGTPVSVDAFFDALRGMIPDSARVDRLETWVRTASQRHPGWLWRPDGGRSIAMALPLPDAPQPAAALQLELGGMRVPQLTVCIESVRESLQRAGRTPAAAENLRRLAAFRVGEPEAGAGGRDLRIPLHKLTDDTLERVEDVLAEWLTDPLVAGLPA